MSPEGDLRGLCFRTRPWASDRGVSALKFVLWRAFDVSDTHAHTHVCVHLWHLGSGLRAGLVQSVTLKAYCHKCYHSGPNPSARVLACVLANCIKYRESCVLSTSNNVRSRHGFSLQGRAEQKCLGKRKSKIINLSDPSSQLECSRLLSNKLLLLSSAQHSLLCCSSCSKSWFRSK